MNRWSLKNSVLPIGYNQFLNLTEQFAKAVEAEFGQRCKLEVKAFSSMPFYSTHLDPYDDGEFERQSNEAKVFVRTPQIRYKGLSKTDWNKAAHVEVIVHPENPGTGGLPDYAFAKMEVKGHKSRWATFYIQPDGDLTRDAMLQQNRTMRRGNGWPSNSSIL